MVKNSLLYQKMKISISSFNEKTTMITPSKMLTFFNSGYKYSMDILQDVRGRKIHQTNPSNLKDQRKKYY
jgi:hypothetical protein